MSDVAVVARTPTRTDGGDDRGGRPVSGICRLRETHSLSTMSRTVYDKFRRRSGGSGIVGTSGAVLGVMRGDAGNARLPFRRPAHPVGSAEGRQHHSSTQGSVPR